jgi:hypothetical protein
VSGVLFRRRLRRQPLFLFLERAPRIPRLGSLYICSLIVRFEGDGNAVQRSMRLLAVCDGGAGEGKLSNRAGSSRSGGVLYLVKNRKVDIDMRTR